MNVQKHEKGFSLIELLIVVVIIGLIAAIAIPNLIASRRAANEASAISTLRAYHAGQATYQSTSGAGSFAGIAGGANAMGILADLGILDPTFKLTSPNDFAVKSGYQFRGESYPASSTAPASHLCVAQPTDITTGMLRTGMRYFGIATDGVIYQRPIDDGELTWNSNPYYFTNGTPLAQAP